jgi:hypothetical protein
MPPSSAGSKQAPHPMPLVKALAMLASSWATCPHPLIFTCFIYLSFSHPILKGKVFGYKIKLKKWGYSQF